MSVRPKLPYIDITNWLGLSTKTSNEITADAALTISKNTDFFEKFGAVSKCPGSRRILSSIYTEAGLTKSIPWVGFYKAPDLNGQILRHVLIAAGTKLHKVETSGAVTALTGVGFPITEIRTEGLFHSADQFADFLLIQNQNPDLVGQGDTPVKYDGAEIQRWGIVPPGSLETVRETFSDIGSFVLVNCTGSNERTTTLDGNAIKITATGVAATITKTGLASFAVNNTIPDRAQIAVYIPRGQIFNLDEGTGTPALSIRVGTDVTANYHRFDIDRGELLEGWNLLSLDFSAPSATIGAPGVSALTSLQITINSAGASDLIENIGFDRFLTFDVGTPTLAEGAAGSTFAQGDVYSYKVTYNSKYGNVSNAGPESVNLTPSQSRTSIILTNIPISTDPQIISRTLWRTVGNGEIHLFLATLNNNSDTSYTDTTNDTALGDTSPPLEGDVSEDASPPPKAGIVKRWKDTIFLTGIPDRPEVVVFSEHDAPERFPTLNEVQLDSKVTAIYETYSGLVVETETGKWQVTGDNPDFRFDKIISNIGCVGRRAAGQTRIVGYAIDREGIRLYDLNNPTKISEMIRDKFDAFNKENIELIHSSHSKSRNCIEIFVPNSDAEYSGNNFIYQYPVDDIYRGWWWQLVLPDSLNPLHSTEIEDSNGDFKIYFSGDDGMVYELFASGQKNWVLADGSIEAITTQFQTKYFRAASSNEASEEFTGRIQPRMIELRYEGDQDNTWTVLVETANGATQNVAVDSESLTFTFGQSEGLLRLPVPSMQPAEYIRVTVTNSTLSKTGKITGLRILFQPRPGQFPIETGQLNPSIPQAVE